MAPVPLLARYLVLIIENRNRKHKSSKFRHFYFYLREWLDISPEQQKAPPETLALSMGTDYILIRFALLAALGGSGLKYFWQARRLR